MGLGTSPSAWMQRVLRCVCFGNVRGGREESVRRGLCVVCLNQSINCTHSPGVLAINRPTNQQINQSTPPPLPFPIIHERRHLPDGDGKGAVGGGHGQHRAEVDPRRADEEEQGAQHKAEEEGAAGVQEAAEAGQGRARQRQEGVLPQDVGELRLLRVRVRPLPVDERAAQGRPQQAGEGEGDAEDGAGAALALVVPVFGFFWGWGEVEGWTSQSLSPSVSQV